MIYLLLMPSCSSTSQLLHLGTLWRWFLASWTKQRLRASKCRGLAGRSLFLKGILMRQLSSALCTCSLHTITLAILKPLNLANPVLFKLQHLLTPTQQSPFQGLIHSSQTLRSIHTFCFTFFWRDQDSSLSIFYLYIWCYHSKFFFQYLKTQIY